MTDNLMTDNLMTETDLITSLFKQKLIADQKFRNYLPYPIKLVTVFPYGDIVSRVPPQNVVRIFGRFYAPMNIDKPGIVRFKDDGYTAKLHDGEIKSILILPSHDRTGQIIKYERFEYEPSTLYIITIAEVVQQVKDQDYHILAPQYLQYQPIPPKDGCIIC